MEGEQPCPRDCSTMRNHETGLGQGSGRDEAGAKESAALQDLWVSGVLSPSETEIKRKTGKGT